ncbi:ATP/GTP-binding protein [Streptomyces cavernicola]|uniref:ATP/GTP-binding protein n=1 Tax=Streptomyces cavernicola TaxID=3043613 RepID=A0ABT6SJH0_9ACTN|nr:ATP/GTP-binding protein [Streptomyces sp. B-S-A6]MDI3408347.1 ATP/GTP-binding protein [Streptomyces sp. B-S-A6]
MLRPAATAAASVALLLTTAPTALADDGPAVGNDPGCKGSVLNVTVCAKESAVRPGASGMEGAKPAAKKKRGNAAPKCTYEKLKPQPPKANAVYEDRKPGQKGAVYRIICPDTGRVGISWIPAGGAPAAPAIDPEVVARQAVDQMKLVGPDIASPRATGKYTVGVPMWLWVNQGATTYGPNSATATAGSVTVTANAEVTDIEWNLGDGSDSVHCDGPGTPYKESYGMKESPDCGHLFRMPSKGEPDGKYQGTATATWTVEWQVNGGGETGQFTEVRETDFAVSVGELKVLD